jgi:FkbM family methyltransferase
LRKRWDANIDDGRTILLMALACGREGRVLACEPNPLLAGTYLPGNLALNGCREQVEICQKVVGNIDDQTVNFVLHDGDYATSSLERWAYPHRVEAIQVSMVTLDCLCADWPRLDLVKVDAEGAEALVWEGMHETLKRFPRAAVLVELHLQRDPPQTMSFLHRLEGSGYSLRFVNYDGDVMPTDDETILANLQEHWMLWLAR